MPEKPVTSYHGLVRINSPYIEVTDMTLRPQRQVVSALSLCTFIEVMLP